MKKPNFAKTHRAIERKAKRTKVAKTTKARVGAESVELCEFIEGALNGYLAEQCKEKTNHLEPCDEETHEGCSCGTGGKSGEVDLVILIDSSSSMNASASAINDAAAEGLEAAKAECGTDARVKWFWVDKAKPGSSPQHNLNITSSSAPMGNFAQSHQQYLEGIGATGPFYHDQAAGSTSWHGEQGADAVADISEFYDWRDRACRSILYISDTILEGVGSNAADADVAVAQAVSVANSNSVTVFAHYLGSSAQNVEDYVNLTEGTGGSAVTGQAPSVDLYRELLVKAICECGGGCSEIEIPEMEPCISVSWGDGECDGMETDDTETFCITLCNCYTNISFSGVSIGYVWVLDEDGTNVAVLPDGTPSVEAVPHGPICFGDIGPCIDNEPSCVSREFVIQTRGAKEGKYRLLIGAVCYDVVHHFDINACFELELCKS